MNNTGLPDEALEKLRIVFASHPEIRKVTLYGSRAKGMYRTGSDIDLCVNAPDWTLSDLSNLTVELDDLNLPWILDVNLEHLIQLPELKEHIQRVGLPLFRRP